MLGYSDPRSDYGFLDDTVSASVAVSSFVLRPHYPVLGGGGEGLGANRPIDLMMGTAA